MFGFSGRSKIDSWHKASFFLSILSILSIIENTLYGIVWLSSGSNTSLFSMLGQFFEISPEISMVRLEPVQLLKVGIKRELVFPFPVPAQTKQCCSFVVSEYKTLFPFRPKITPWTFPLFPHFRFTSFF